MQATPSPISNSVNLGNPVNWNHPLNLQRIGWWKVLPSWNAGSNWYNLVNFRSGSLTNSGGSGQPTFSSLSSPGGYGSLQFTSSNSQYVSVPSIPNAPNTSACTMAVWTYTPSNPTSLCTLATSRTGNITALLASGYSSHCLTTNWNNSSAEYNANTGLTWNTNAWVFCVGVVNGTSETTYMIKNGGVLSSYNLSITSNSHQVSGVWQIGGDPANAGRWWNGYLDDASVWTRALSVTEIYELYELSQQGYPGVLNRASTITYFFPSSPLVANYAALLMVT